MRFFMHVYVFLIDAIPTKPPSAALHGKEMPPLSLVRFSKASMLGGAGAGREACPGRAGRQAVGGKAL